MCLAIPGKIITNEVQNGIRVGRVQFGGITRETCLDFVPEASVGRLRDCACRIRNQSVWTVKKPSGATRRSNPWDFSRTNCSPI